MLLKPCLLALSFLAINEMMKGRGRHTLRAPMNPKTLSTFAKCRYQLKLLARWYGSSGNW